ncbi:MAG TPA: thioesterase family protein [Geothrix sp.]|nr:thioesterase family protein [Geothrix sp.]
MSFTHPIEVRFRDLDAMGHVNNAVVVSFMEQARVYWWHLFLGNRPFKEDGFLIARVEVDYRMPILLTDKVCVELTCTKVGNTSFDLAYRLTKGPGGNVFAEGKTIQVMLDFATHRPKPLSPAIRAWIEAEG